MENVIAIKDFKFWPIGMGHPHTIIPRGTILSCKKFYGDYYISNKEFQCSIIQSTLRHYFSTVRNHRNKTLGDVLNKNVQRV